MVHLPQWSGQSNPSHDDDAAHEYVHTAAHFVNKEVHDRNLSAPEVRPKAEIVNDTEEHGDSE